jgi:integrase
MHVWSPAELAAFHAAIEGNRNDALFRLLAMTGMRRSEVVGLRWCDVDLAAGSLTVAQAATLVDGDEVVAVPKTRRSRRVIDLDADTAAVLQRHRARQRELYLRLGATASASGRVFTQRGRRSHPPELDRPGVHPFRPGCWCPEDPTPRPP